MEPSNNQNIYRLSVKCPGLVNPMCAGAVTGYTLGSFCGLSAECCLTGALIGGLAEDCLRRPHTFNLGGIEINNRTVIVHMPNIQRMHRE